MASLPRSALPGACFLAILLVLSCAHSGPEIPPGGIDPGLAPEIRTHVERLYDPDAAQRAAAAMTLRSLGGRAIPAVPYLVTLLGDETPVSLQRGGLRTFTVTTTPGKEAALALGGIGPEAVLPLIRVLKHNDPNVRENAAWALGIIRDPRAEDSLKSMLWDTDRRVRQVSEWALKQIENRRRPPTPVQRSI